MNVINTACRFSRETGGVVIVNVSDIAIQQIKSFKREFESVRHVYAKLAIPDGRRFRLDAIVFN